MSDTEQLAISKLSELKDGDEAICFAALVRKQQGKTYKGEAFTKCYFRDRYVNIEAPIWANSRFAQVAPGWVDGEFYRLQVKASVTPKYGLQLDIHDIRPACSDDAADGFDIAELVESSEFSTDEMWRSLRETINRCVDDPHVRQLVETLLDEHAELFGRMQAAANFHHSFTGGLLEHVRSVTRISSFVADHYAKYYRRLNPPLNRSVVVAAAVLHDIGKLREFKYHPVEAKYTKEGSLIGHVLMGRDMVREAALKIADFPEETLLLLEHAILSHHGKREFGAPVLPQTIEALIVSFVDDLDAKVNVVARGLLKAEGDTEFTDKLYALDNRRFYRGVPAEPGDNLA